jgi:hypothetical protein
MGSSGIAPFDIEMPMMANLLLVSLVEQVRPLAVAR